MRTVYPGILRHAALAAISVPLWWWFEFVNERVQNWQYVHPFDANFAALGALSRIEGWHDLHPLASSPFWYLLLSSAAFSTVVPAVMAATALVRRFAPGDPSLSPASAALGWFQIAAGMLLQALVFALPGQMYPFVWVAPFLIGDGVGALLTGHSLGAGLLRGNVREAALIGAAGLLCGVLWEFWNFWSVPSWQYHVPLLGFWKLFEMPLLGYLGYVPFAWTVAAVVRLLDTVWRDASVRRHRLFRQDAAPAHFAPGRASRAEGKD